MNFPFSFGSKLSVANCKLSMVLYCVTNVKLLNPGKETTGHKHVGQEEVYIFASGSGRMIVDGDTYNEFGVAAGDVVLIPDGAFHKVINNGTEPLYFVCVFDGDRRNHS